MEKLLILFHLKGIVLINKETSFCLPLKNKLMVVVHVDAES